MRHTPIRHTHEIHAREVHAYVMHNYGLYAPEMHEMLVRCTPREM
jgi:hypothetical protein